MCSEVGNFNPNLTPPQGRGEELEIEQHTGKETSVKTQKQGLESFQAGKHMEVPGG